MAPSAPATYKPAMKKALIIENTAAIAIVDHPSPAVVIRDRRMGFNLATMERPPWISPPRLYRNRLAGTSQWMTIIVINPGIPRRPMPAKAQARGGPRWYRSIDRRPRPGVSGWALPFGDQNPVGPSSSPPRYGVPWGHPYPEEGIQAFWRTRRGIHSWTLGLPESEMKWCKYPLNRT